MLATAAALAPAQAQSPAPYTEVDLDSFWDCLVLQVQNNFICPLPAGGGRMHGPFFVQATSPTGDAYCCQSNPIVITAGTEVEVSGTVDITVCGSYKAGMSLSKKTSTTVQTTHPPFLCGCMVLTAQQNYCVYVSEAHVNYCSILGEHGNTRRWWKHYVIPAGVPSIAPYYYADPVRCSCPVGVPYAHPNPQVTTPAPTIAPLPTTTQRPWDPGTDGTPPNPDGTWPTQGPPTPGPAAVEFKVDLGTDFKQRMLNSALDLNLYECRMIVRALYDELRQTGSHAGPDTPTVVQITDDIKLTGTLNSIIKQLRQYASDRVRSKTYGDFDGDGERTAADFAILQDKVMTPPTEESERRKYDLDGNDQLTGNDLVWWTQINAI
ncbi:MAG TPA: hypothetical protein VEB22_03130 [Phycisphaerales bacterium]|nr:hypothetical protein [Phycisphaerales bacterium]